MQGYNTHTRPTHTNGWGQKITSIEFGWDRHQFVYDSITSIQTHSINNQGISSKPQKQIRLFVTKSLL